MESDYELVSELERTGIVSPSILERTLEKAHENKMDRTACQQTADHIINFFGLSDRIIDNVLEPKDRDVFYMLETDNLLKTEGEETTLYDGRVWRIKYWLYNTTRMNELLRLKPPKQNPEDESKIYDNLPSEAWPIAV